MPISDKKEKAADRDNSMLELSAERSKVKLKYEAMCAHSIIPLGSVPNAHLTATTVGSSRW
jgi:hypothetical protein